MKVLLDTHVFMWWDADQLKLSPLALATLQNAAFSSAIGFTW
jgi:PIN domain nuclease of toxin-antitoxin system